MATFFPSKFFPSLPTQHHVGATSCGMGAKGMSFALTLLL